MLSDAFQQVNRYDVGVAIVGATVAAVFCSIVLKVQLRHWGFAVDTQVGPQKIHQDPTPRIGGVGLVIGMLLQAALSASDTNNLTWLVVLAALPVFIAGVAEDVTKEISPHIRLFAAFLTGVVFCWLTGVWVTDVELAEVNYFLAFSGVGIGLTIVAVAALANAVNIIDGLNGLSLGTSLFAATAIAILAASQGDAALVHLALYFSAALLGVLVFNFPFGKIFVGDGGAYFMGAMIAGIAVLLPERNDAVSPFASLLIIFYPFYELVRSFVRRLVGNGARAMRPDNKHLHSLMFRLVSQRTTIAPWLQNVLASCFMLVLPVANCLWALKYFDDRDKIIIGILGFVIAYEGAMRILKKKLQ
jgi:UDP-N-acetylmuramyl pentapeptide phosphotransferase/UDP-N-acetylglucosamine-1-phosphate transferase